MTNTSTQLIHVCFYCGKHFATRFYKQMHLNTGCPQQPIAQRLTQDEFQRLLNRAKEIDDARTAKRHE